LSVVRDVTESKQAQEALQDSEERFRQLADNIASEAAQLDRTIGSFLGGAQAAASGS